MNKIIVLSLLFLILLNISSCKQAPVDAPEIITKITGKITDGQNNQPIAGVQVTTSPVTSSVNTGQEGVYTISDIKAGQYTITAKKEGYNDNTTTVTVSEGKTVNADIQMIQEGPELEVSTTLLDFDVALTSLTFTIKNKTQAGTVTWQVTSNQSWLVPSPTTGTTTNESDVISVTVSRDSLNYGNYAGLISVSSDHGSEQISVTMIIQNPNAPQLSAIPTALDFGNSTIEKILSIKNTGTGILNWTATTSANWISLSQNSGIATSNGPSNISVLVNRSGMQANNHEGLILLSSNGGEESVLIKMIVEPGTLTAPVLQLDGTPTENSVSIGWSVISDPSFSSYKIYRSLTSGVSENSTLVTTINNSGDNLYTDNNLTSGTTYYYKVYVYNQNNIGSGSNEVNATTAVGVKNWVLQTEFPNVTFYKVFANSDNDCWAVGEIYENSTSIGYYAKWNGSEWKGYKVSGIYSINDLFFKSANEGYALAYNSSKKIILMKYDGISWSNITTEISTSTSGPKMCVFSSHLIYVLSGYSNKIWKYDGANWSSSTVGASYYYFEHIVGVSESNIWTLNDNNEIFTFNGIGWGKNDQASNHAYNSCKQFRIIDSTPYKDGVYKFINNNWNQIKDKDGSEVYNIYSFYYLNNNFGWVGSYNGKLYLYNGTYLEEKSSPTTKQINDIFLLNQTSGWAVGTGGIILRYK